MLYRIGPTAVYKSTMVCKTTIGYKSESITKLFSTGKSVLEVGSTNTEFSVHKVLMLPCKKLDDLEFKGVCA